VQVDGLQHAQPATTARFTVNRQRSAPPRPAATRPAMAGVGARRI
jgi:hypothetical protein